MDNLDQALRYNPFDGDFGDVDEWWQQNTHDARLHRLLAAMWVTWRYRRWSRRQV